MHDGHKPLWAHWRTVEGGFLLDRQSLFECYLIATGIADFSDRSIADLAHERLRSANVHRDDIRKELQHILSVVLEAGLEHCPHHQPLGIDLALPRPFQAMDDIIVYGNDQTAPNFAGHTLSLLAGPAHGNGVGPWTRALLQVVARYVRFGDRVADIGTGTGILGLYAALRGAASVDSADIDPISVAIARRNARANGLDRKVTTHLGSAHTLIGSFDVGIVSLQAVSELPPVLADMFALLRPGGWLIGSPAEGQGEADILMSFMRAVGVEELNLVHVENWYVACGRRPNGSSIQSQSVPIDPRLV